MASKVRRAGVVALAAMLGLSGRAARADVFANVPEAAGYNLVYTFDIPNNSLGWNTTAVPYSVNNAASIADNSFSRVGYYIELQSSAAGSPVQYVYASMNADGLTRQASKLGVPTTTSGAFYQQQLTSMNVLSNVPGIVTGTGIATGNIEFWPSNYTQGNTASVPNASGATYDFGDGGADRSNGHGTMQIHNYDVDGAGPGTAGQTLFAYNAWGAARASEFGVGNQVGGSGNPDWTFNTTNIATYSLKRLQVVVGGPALPAPPPPPPPGLKYMPLGDSITYGQPVGGGYRTRLFSLLSAADPAHTPDFVGSATDNQSTALSTAGETNHEGHPGYRVNQLTPNLDGNDNTGGNNGGYWLTGGGTTGRGPQAVDYVLLHIGTNDISQLGTSVTPDQSAVIVRDRLEALVAKIESLRPDAVLIVASLIPRSDSLEGTNVKYNALVEALVADHKAQGQKVYFADLHSRLTTADLTDSVHPNAAGYDKMADGWFAAIQAVPEPTGTWLLVVVGAGALAGRRRRRRRRYFVVSA